MEGAARLLIAVLLAVAGITVGGDREKRMPPCIGDLSPCLPAITDPAVKLLPGSDCCVAVKNALRREKECLCSLFNTSSSRSFFSFFSPTFPIDMMSRTLAIPGVCGISAADLSKCDNDGPAFPTSTPSPTFEASASSPRLINRESASPTSSSTPSTESSSSPPTGSGSKNSAGRLNSAVKPWLALLLFLFASSLIFVPPSYY